ncbi:TetR/AcrR family transcriptional regulator [Aeromicrobium sp. 50.2.37]|uniref:TetR/AcrR family transcriptional regulator n=1 Tax=Aeromicrobium sp. 50.2.37 TaxID=2969305 RepID=UPI00214F6CB9|nr:TetR/AcrR family transcriptional regulator [Aeromicrobium sp. 50.2.37]MCR4514115.1 TetR/AcrR family transcriptional regulator [Aeromicrobium sp. 50.2.37]
MRGPSEDKILLAAAQAFAEHGFAGATVRQVADRCQMSTGSLFHHYAGKRDLLVAVVAEGTMQAFTHVTERLADVTGARVRLETLVEAHLETLHGTSRPFSTVATQEFHRLEQDERQRVVRVRDAYEALWQEVLDEGAEAGILPHDPLLRLFLLGAVNQAFFWYDPSSDLSLTDLSRRFVDFVVPARVGSEPAVGSTAAGEQR